MPVTVDLSRNPKQAQFFYDTMGAVKRYEMSRTDPEYVDPDPIRFLSYGGAIRGGKTFVCLFILVMLCRMFPGSRWHVIRASLPDLIRNAEPSLRRILGAKLVRWRRSGSDYYVQFRNGSRIYFMAETFNADKDLNRFKGLETNGFLLEQAEELQHATFQKCIERAGSHYTAKQPPAFVFLTFNPAYNWVRDLIWTPWHKGELKPPYYFLEALPDDNPFVTGDQWEVWKALDDKTYSRFIRGDWDIDIDGRFAWAFSRRTHVGRPEYDPNERLWVSFDFNVDPSTAIVFQSDGERWFRVLKEYRIEGGDTYRLCEAIKEDWEHLNPWLWVTGDATGKNRMSGARGAVSQYHIIQEELNLPWDRFVVPRSNPLIADSRVLTNSVIQRLQEFVVHEECEWLIHDLSFVLIKRDQQGRVQIQKTGKLQHARLGAESMGHLLDCVRYGVHVTLADFVHIHRS